MFSQRSAPPVPEVRLDPADLRDLKASKDLRVCVERWDPLETVEVLDQRAREAAQAKTATQDVMVIPDLKEFKDQRASVDHPAFQVFLE